MVVTSCRVSARWFCSVADPPAIMYVVWLACLTETKKAQSYDMNFVNYARSCDPPC